MSTIVPCGRCGHDAAFHQKGTGHGVPVGQEYCDDRHGPKCDCTGFRYLGMAPKLPKPLGAVPGKPEMVNAPPHYASLSPQPMEVGEAWDLDPHRFNALKYIARAGRKGSPQDAILDLKKAVAFLNRRIQLWETRLKNCEPA